MMRVGMLWFNNDPKMGLSQKVVGAADYFEKKYGKRPDLCFVHPSMVAGLLKENELSIKFDGVEVRVTRAVLPNHYWIGNNGKVDVSELPGD